MTVYRSSYKQNETSETKTNIIVNKSINTYNDISETELFGPLKQEQRVFHACIILHYDSNSTQGPSSYLKYEHKDRI